MRHRFVALALVTVGSVVGWLTILPHADQAPGTASNDRKPPVTPWGDPDLQGMWDTRSGVPLERPAEFGNREFMTEAEAVDRRRRGLDTVASGEDDDGEADLLAEEDKRREEIAQQPDAGLPGHRIAGAEYNAFWSADPTRARMSLRTSRIVDPPDGRLPALTRQALTRWQARHEARKGRSQADSWEDRNPQERCLMRPGLAVGEMIGSNQFSVADVIQSPGQVAIVMPYGQARVIRIGEGPHVGSTIRAWYGDSVGRWEGHTLVVETTNFKAKQDGGPILTVRRPWNYYPGSGETLRFIERFTLLNADTLEYRYTVDDGNVFVKPWTAVADFARDTWSAEGKQDRIMEYACHEHNYGIVNALKATRVNRARGLDEEKREAAVRVKELAAKWEQLKKWEATQKGAK